MKHDSKKHEKRFDDLGLSEGLVKVLTRLNFTTPTPIQAKAIPVALTGRDVIGIAQTGTGKTLSFFLPMLHNIDQHKGMGLIVVPTRELAHQVRDEIDKVGGRIGFKTALLIGGAPMDRQVRALKRRPHIIVATPGRLNDHIERRTVNLHRVGVLVLDEADRMLDMGFAPQINQILETIPKDHQTLLFSATMPPAVARIAQGYMNNPVSVEVAPTEVAAKNIEQGVYYVEVSNKLQLLLDLLNEYDNGPVLVFCRTKHGTKKMAHVLNQEGFKAEELHSNRSLSQRRRALDNFKRGKSRVMVATDVAARGIDVKEIVLVVNYDLPDQHEDYVHRIGRTGRAGHTGNAVSFVVPDQYHDMKAIERLVGREIEVLETRGTLTAEDVAMLSKRTRRPSARSRSRGRRPVGGRRGGRARRHGGRATGGARSRTRQENKRAPNGGNRRSTYGRKSSGVEDSRPAYGRRSPGASRQGGGRYGESNRHTGGNRRTGGKRSVGGNRQHRKSY